MLISLSVLSCLLSNDACGHLSFVALEQLFFSPTGWIQNLLVVWSSCTNLVDWVEWFLFFPNTFTTILPNDLSACPALLLSSSSGRRFSLLWPVITGQNRRSSLNSQNSESVSRPASNLTTNGRMQVTVPISSTSISLTLLNDLRDQRLFLFADLYQMSIAIITFLNAFLLFFPFQIAFWMCVFWKTLLISNVVVNIAIVVVCVNLFDCLSLSIPDVQSNPFLRF